MKTNQSIKMYQFWRKTRPLGSTSR